MIPSYGERHKDFSITAHVVDETPDAHVVEVTMHDRFDEISVLLKVHKNGEWFGTMIPWVALRIAIVDLAAASFERVRRLESGRMESEVWPVDVAKYLKTLGSIPDLSLEAQDLPEHILRGHMFFLAEGEAERNYGITAAQASLHNIRKELFDQGLPDEVRFFYLYRIGRRRAEKGYPGVQFHWPRLSLMYQGFDWKDPGSAWAVEELFGMLNLHHPVDIEAMKPPHSRPYANGPKDWTPEQPPAFLVKGVDYGPPPA